ncbi:UAA transporter [Aaosphaeria arxii CBS 175.79]|uniref:UAA transporter n=1 Tax=Aaosphaeria arxii CBS 175.79 TaxID=1450172 RepID=A0A6A5XFH4_9PLEO|nr:UAA transporter [Aaosphaeria arxii CBS 175.79]KAF2011832.1 UAA transporter [Aaosphaeria arxii CBS 175.79]
MINMHYSLAQLVIPLLSMETFTILVLIFGGCCTNVYTLETIIQHGTDSRPALALTFIQFVFVAVEGFAYFFRFHSRTLLKQPEVSRVKWLGFAVIHFSISVLNNISLEYHVSVPMHIVLRSGGGLVTLVVGTLFGKSYSKTKWMSVMLMTLGVVIAALSGTKDSKDGDHISGTMSFGVFLLLIIQILVAIMGILLENIYKRSPGIWREGLFYTHLLAIPFFLPLLPKITMQLMVLASGTQLEMMVPRISYQAWDLPMKFVLLVLNAFTQFLCVTGVNLLTSVSSALSVCIVLSMRKFVSLLISVWVFKTPVHADFVFGTAIVFGGVIMYATDNWKRKT